MSSVFRRIGWLLAGATVACAGARPASRTDLDQTTCQQWRLTVVNGSPQTVSIYVTGEGPRRFMGWVGPQRQRQWVVSSEPIRVEAEGGARDEAEGVVMYYTCLSR